MEAREANEMGTFVVFLGVIAPNEMNTFLVFLGVTAPNASSKLCFTGTLDKERHWKSDIQGKSERERGGELC